MTKVLVVDDEPAISTLLTYNLEQQGIEPLTATDGASALKIIQAEHDQLDCILLDLMLPGMSGLDVLKQMQIQALDTPVIIITAKSQEVDRILGLELGADDYISKPFSPREVVARINAVIRRNQKATQNNSQALFVLDELKINREQHIVTVAEHPLSLTPKEYELLLYFVTNKQQVLSRQQLMEHVWEVQADVDSRMVDIQVSHLRDKLKKIRPRAELDQNGSRFWLSIRNGVTHEKKPFSSIS